MNQGEDVVTMIFGRELVLAVDPNNRNGQSLSLVLADFLEAGHNNKVGQKFFVIPRSNKHIVVRPVADNVGVKINISELRELLAERLMVDYTKINIKVLDLPY